MREGLNLFSPAVPAIIALNQARFVLIKFDVILDIFLRNIPQFLLSARVITSDVSVRLYIFCSRMLLQSVNDSFWCGCIDANQCHNHLRVIFRSFSLQRHKCLFNCSLLAQTAGMATITAIKIKQKILNISSK